MSDTTSSDSLLSRLVTPALALLTAAVFAGSFHRPKYAPRPATEALAPAPSRTKSEAPALLTEDPLDAAYRWRALLDEDARGKLPGVKVLGDEIAAHAKDCVLVLGVWMRSGDWPEDSETRARTRQAVVWALLAEQRFKPLDPRQCSVIEVAADPDLAADQPWIVPYQWFERNGATQADCPYSHVLALWLDEGALGTRPLSRVEQLLSKVRAARECGEHFDVCMLGPSNSGSLIALLDDAACGDVLAAPALEPPLLFLSPYATAPLQHAHLKHVEGVTADDPRMRLVRTIGQDDAIADLLVAELAERIPDLMVLDGGSGSARSSLLDEHSALVAAVEVLRLSHFLPPRAPVVRVALVAQQDTDYGRFWIQTMERARDNAKSALPMLGRLEFEPVQYVGGIDGRAPGHASTDASGDARAAERGYPSGASQIDYLKRLEAELDRRPGFAAVGVFGTDVYDTLMILEALRARFPEALFFTVDLDARFLDPEHEPYTRNLVVASHLPLGEDQATLQFRDLYQFSVYRTVERWMRSCDAAKVEAPRLYEIGMHRAVELNTGTHLQPFGLVPWTGAAKLWRGLFPRVHAQESSKAGAKGEGASAASAGPPPILLLVGALLIGALILVVGHAPRKPNDASATGRWRMRIVAISAGLLLCGAVLWLCSTAVDVSQLHAIEPLDLLQGVSAWPAVILRLTAATFALVSFVRIRAGLSASHTRLAHEFLLYRPGGKLPASTRANKRWFFGRKSTNGTSVPAQEVWLAVRHWIDAGFDQWLRAIGFALLCHFSIGPFYALAPVASPVRGEFALIVERTSVLIAVWSFFLLIALVLEISFCCCRLSLRIADRHTTRLPMWLLRAEHRRSGLRATQVDQRVRLRLVAALTREVESLVYYPTVAACLIIAARATLFDSWSWPPVLIGTFCLFFLLLFLCALNTRRIAQEEKQSGLEFFRNEALRYAGDAPSVKRIELVRQEIESLRGGAFSPLFEHPLVRSAFAPVIAYLSTVSLDPARLSSWLS